MYYNKRLFRSKRPQRLRKLDLRKRVRRDNDLLSYSKGLFIAMLDHKGQYELAQTNVIPFHRRGPISYRTYSPSENTHPSDASQKI
jgi:hypothetical protein